MMVMTVRDDGDDTDDDDGDSTHDGDYIDDDRL